MHDISELESLASDICELQSSVGRLKRQSETAVLRLEEVLKPNELRTSLSYWKFKLGRDATRRIELFIQQNFSLLEPMGLLVVTRYLFELTIWLKLVLQEEDNLRTYQYQLIDGQLRYYQDQRAHILLEIALFNRFSKLEQEKLSSAFESNKAHDPTVIEKIVAEIDGEVSRQFSIYGENAKSNGYSFQAFLLESKMLPRIDTCISELQAELDIYENQGFGAAGERAKKKWNWKSEAKKVGMESEYDFIYCFTSKLIHATPASISTDQQNLGTDEMRVFLKYIHIRLQDICRMVSQLMEAG